MAGLEPSLVPPVYGEQLEKAVSPERKYAIHFAELDELYEQAGTPIEKRLPLFEKNQDVVAQRDDAQNRAVVFKVAAGKYDDAIKMMTDRKFAIAGGANLNVVVAKTITCGFSAIALSRCRRRQSVFEC